MVRTSYIFWEDDDVLFVLDQHVWLDFLLCYLTEKQQPASRHVITFWHIIQASQSLLRFLNAVCLAEKQQILNL
jgi:hypothetical protein